MICVGYINKKSVGKKGTREHFLPVGILYTRGTKVIKYVF